MAKKESKFLSQQIAENILIILDREIQLMLKMGKGVAKQPLDGKDAVKLEKYTKAYATIAASQRADIESGLLGNMSDEELQELAGQSDEEDNGTDS